MSVGTRRCPMASPRRMPIPVAGVRTARCGSSISTRPPAICSSCPAGPIKGPRQDIIPDIIVYVNGLPLAVIECKSPALADPMGDAVRQFRRYEGRDEFFGLGAPRLFETAQLSIALAREWRNMERR